MRIIQRSVTCLAIACVLVAALLLMVSKVRSAGAGGVVTDCSNDTQFSNLLAGGGTVTFNCGGAPHTILIASQKSINVNTTIDGGGKITLDGQDAIRLFDVGAKLTLRNIVLTRASFIGDGGAIINRSNGTLILENSVIQNSTAISGNGGGIVSFGPLTITNSQLEGNEAFNGGALYPVFSGARTTIINSVLRDNHATDTTYGWGGAILAAEGAPVTIEGSSIYSNTAKFGGGIFSNRGAVTMTSVTLSRNSAIYGAAMQNDNNGTTTLTNATLSNNSATDTGGGILNNGTATLTNVTLSSNSATNGGGIYNWANSVLQLTDVTLSGNSASSTGGGLYNDGTSTLTNVTLSGNSATNGGGIYNNTSSVLTLTKVTLSSNSASYGGGLLNYGMAMLTNATLRYNSSGGNGGGLDNAGTLTMTNATLSGNFAIAGGGLFSLGTATLTNATLSGNLATNGGGLYNYDGSATLTNVTLSGNTASANGGGIYRTNGSVNVKNTIVANSPSGMNCAGTVVNNGFNFSSDNTCPFGSGRISVTVMLGPLANNGGPTLTHMPQANSPVIDNITSGCPPPATDQRGAKRPFDGDGNGSVRCDVGAVEYGAPVSVVYVPLTLKNYVAYFEGPWEVESNNFYTQANGSLRFGRNYFGYPNDNNDYFSIYLQAPGPISITLNFTTETDAQAILYYQTPNTSCPNSQYPKDTTVCDRDYVDKGKKKRTYAVDFDATNGGWYYIRIYTPTNHDYANQYTLRTIYP